jgi:hypothetical protein
MNLKYLVATCLILSCVIDQSLLQATTTCPSLVPVENFDLKKVN